MKSLATLVNTYTNLSNNTSGTNQSLGIQLLGDRQRYMLEKYFDNERTFTTTTVGAMNLDVTAVIDGGSTSATLSGAWLYPTGVQQVEFTNTAGTAYATTTTLASAAVSGTLSASWTGPSGLQSITFTNTNNDVRDVKFTNGSTAISWTEPLSSATTSTAITTGSTSEYHQVTFTNASTTISWTTPLTYGISDTAISTGGYQKYRIPPGISKITNGTVTVGQLRFVPAPVQTRTQWDNINFLPYSSDIPNYFYIYNGFIEFWPVPSTTGNVITFNYKSRVPEFSTAFLFSDTSGTAYVAGSTVYDYQAGSLSGITEGSGTITGSSTSWNTTGKFPLNTDVSIYNLYLIINAPNGEGIWYPIQQFNSDTSLTLAYPIQSAPSSTSATHGYSIAQLPVLSEDFHDALIYGALINYYTNIATDLNKAKENQNEYDRRLLLLADYAGTKQVNYNLGERPALLNPNNYPFYPNGVND